MIQRIPCFSELTPRNAVGQVLLQDYDTATVAVHDFHRERAGGLARGAFLLAGDAPAGDEASFVLLRVAGATRLSNQAATDDARLTAARDAVGRELWSEGLAKWVQDEVALAGVEAHVLGTITSGPDRHLAFAEDVANYYSAHGAYAWKPGGELLERIVNLTHRGNSLDFSGLGISARDIRVGVAHTRFAAADQGDESNPSRVAVRINPTDLLKRRTAFLGMSRSGKSNAMKIVARAVYLLRKRHNKLRVGQLIFDPNGEYAQDNPQDGRGLHRVHDLLDRDRDGEVATYGRYEVPSDPDRCITKINFFGNQILPSLRTDRSGTERALEQLLVGRDLIRERLEGETGVRYIQSFRDADLSVPQELGDRGAATRYHRAVLVHRVALAAAGFERPPGQVDLAGLFGKAICDALSSTDNDRSDNVGIYASAAATLRQSSVSWDRMATACIALDTFINDKKSTYNVFEEQYRRSSTSNQDWADPRLKAVLGIFRYPNGVRTFQDLRNQHSAKASSDYAEDIVNDLKDGKLVIVDQSVGNPKLNRQAAKRIMRKVFDAQQLMFTSPQARPPWEGHVLVYVEEAHNLLPQGGGRDVLSTVWARAAKEGGKMNLGMVLATQAPSSVLKEILSETDNWFISHLNSDAEARVVEGYQDFKHFVPQIRRISEPGFIRLRTLSAGYTVPVQLERFRPPRPERRCLREAIRIESHAQCGSQERPENSRSCDPGCRYVSEAYTSQ